MKDVIILRIALLSAVLISAFQNCGYLAAPIDSKFLASESSFSVVYFDELKSRVLQTNCLYCHAAGSSAGGGVDLSNYSNVKALVKAGSPESSALYTSITQGRMPKGGGALPTSLANVVKQWILTGAQEKPTSSGTQIYPAVRGGNDQTIVAGGSAVFSATASDADGTIVSYLWTKTLGGGATLAGANTSRLTVSGVTAGTYVFRVTVSDNSGLSTYDDVQLVVTSKPSTPVPTPVPTPTPVSTATYSALYSNILQRRCSPCHSSVVANYGSLVGNSSWIQKGSSAASGFYVRTKNGTMPAGSSALSANDVDLIKRWIDEGAKNN